MTAALKEVMRNTLDNLAGAEFKRFKHYLRDQGQIPWGKLEKADADDTVDAMVQVYGTGAGHVMSDILKKMVHNQLARSLERDLGRVGDQQYSPDAVGGDRGDHVYATAHCGEMVNASALGGAGTAVMGNGTRSAVTLTVPPGGILGYDEAQKRSLKKKLQGCLKTRFSVVHLESGDYTVQDIYVDLHIVDGRTGGVVDTHEVLTINMKRNRTCLGSEAKQVEMGKLFTIKDKFTGKCVTKVLTLGIAGVGKTVAVQKFVMDWAEQKSNQDIDFVFLLIFRELNLKNKKFYSLLDLLLEFYPDLKDLKTFPEFSGCKLLFVFDGLDESRLRFDFQECISEPEKKTSVDVLITSLIKGTLLSSALIWVTTRPAAVGLIPRECFNLVTEVQGFNDPQKIEFFQKNIGNPERAQRVIDYVTKNRSLHIMCHIPVFCHIIASVLEDMDDQSKEEPPKTLTEMYTLFSVGQITRMNEKYSKNMSAEEKGKLLVKLGKLAFTHLEKGTLTFYKKDLEECKINANSEALECGVCTQLFKKESAITGESIFSFVHLSVQEFLAALYFLHKSVYRANPFLKTQKEMISWLFKHSRFDLYRYAVDEALQSQNGHLDLFLRFLLGLAPMLEPEVRHPLDVVLPQLAVREQCIGKTIQYIKEKIREDISPERIINLLHCLNELGDNSLVEEINRYRNSVEKEKNLTPAQCSALAYMLLMSAEDLEEFDLKKYLRSEQGLWRTLPIVKVSKRVLLNQCHLSKASCEMMASVLQGTPSHLRELDMSYNDLQDEGVELLCVGLRHSQCRLETLRLSGCLITHKGCSFLASALKSNSSYLQELDLSYNYPGKSGVRELTDRLNDPNCKLEILRYDHGGECRMKPAPVKYACDLTLDPNTAHRHLSLTEKNKRVTRVGEKQPYPDHQGRFVHWPQVLCREGLSGRCYWEAEWRGYKAAIVVAYKGIQRKETSDDSGFGRNDKSWCLYCSSDNYSACHNKMETVIPVPSSSRVGVYLDWPAGTLSFYSVSSDTLTHLHTFRSTFTEPLCPGFWCYNSSVCLCQIT